MVTEATAIALLGFLSRVYHSQLTDTLESHRSSQPRVANVENGDASVSIELLIRAILATGASPQDIGKVIASVR